jgi:Holliday junction resolvase RusA-like endonuclease
MVRVIRELAYKAVTKLPLETPVRVDIEAIADRPLSHYGTGKNADALKAWAPYFWNVAPDRDNIDKIFLDTLTKLGFWTDDSLVCDGRIIKRYRRDRREATGLLARISDAVAGAHIADDPVQATPQLFAGGKDNP